MPSYRPHVEDLLRPIADGIVLGRRVAEQLVIVRAPHAIVAGAAEAVVVRLEAAHVYVDVATRNTSSVVNHVMSLPLLEKPTRVSTRP